MSDVKRRSVSAVNDALLKVVGRRGEFGSMPAADRELVEDVLLWVNGNEDTAFGRRLEPKSLPAAAEAAKPA